MRIPAYHIDAFAGAIFSGNPAAVCPLERWLDDETLQLIASENNLPATAFARRDRHLVPPAGCGVAMVRPPQDRVQSLIALAHRHEITLQVCEPAEEGGEMPPSSNR